MSVVPVKEGPTFLSFPASWIQKSIVAMYLGSSFLSLEEYKRRQRSRAVAAQCKNLSIVPS
ncbi:MAG TPA: hypothetical protein VIJ63_04505, partial [Roseiarcus sp.]